MTEERIKELEQAEQDGRLLVLPCKIGGSLYCLHNPYKFEVREYGVTNMYVLKGEIDIFARMICKNGRETSSNQCFSNKQIGKTVFFTAEEAESALKRYVSPLAAYMKEAVELEKRIAIAEKEKKEND